MGSILIFLAFALIAIGAIWATACGIILLVRAFRESLLWGFGCILVGVLGLVFMIMHWDQNKRLFFAHLGAVAVMVLGYGLLMLTPLAAGHAFQRTHLATAQSTPEASATPAAPTTAKPAQSPAKSESAKDKKQDLIAQKKDELKELYGSLTSWAQRLQEKRKLLHSEKPDEVRAFNDDSAGYQAALTDYKSQVAQLKKLQEAK